MAKSFDTNCPLSTKDSCPMNFAGGSCCFEKKCWNDYEAQLLPYYPTVESDLNIRRFNRAQMKIS